MSLFRGRGPAPGHAGPWTGHDHELSDPPAVGDLPDHESLFRGQEPATRMVLAVHMMLVPRARPARRSTSHADLPARDPAHPVAAPARHLLDGCRAGTGLSRTPSVTPMTKDL
jgi:hypothetical protein